jgi:hypothetical protein
MIILIILNNNNNNMAHQKSKTSFLARWRHEDF